MGNSGSSYKPPPPTPMPIEDSVGARAEAAALTAMRQSGASRTANDLNQDGASKEPAMTRSQIGKADSFTAQPRPRGPMGGKGPRGPRAPGSMTGNLGGSAVLTG